MFGDRSEASAVESIDRVAMARNVRAVYEVFDPDWNFHEVAQNAIQGATATVRGSMDQVAMTGHVGCRLPITEDGIREHHLAPSMLD